MLLVYGKASLLLGSIREENVINPLPQILLEKHPTGQGWFITYGKKTP